MHKLNISRIVCFRIFLSIIFAHIILLPHVSKAAGGLKVTSKLDVLKEWLLTIATPVAVIALICLSIGLMLGYVEKRTFINWGAGLLIIGSAGPIVDMLIN